MPRLQRQPPFPDVVLASGRRQAGVRKLAADPEKTIVIIQA